jgi:hypothetical protein
MQSEQLMAEYPLVPHVDAGVAVGGASELRREMEWKRPRKEEREANIGCSGLR